MDCPLLLDDFLFQIFNLNQFAVLIFPIFTLKPRICFDYWGVNYPFHHPFNFKLREKHLHEKDKFIDSIRSTFIADLAITWSSLIRLGYFASSLLSIYFILSSTCSNPLWMYVFYTKQWVAASKTDYFNRITNRVYFDYSSYNYHWY